MRKSDIASLWSESVNDVKYGAGSFYGKTAGIGADISGPMLDQRVRPTSSQKKTKQGDEWIMPLTQTFFKKSGKRKIQQSATGDDYFRNKFFYTMCQNAPCNSRQLPIGQVRRRQDIQLRRLVVMANLAAHREENRISCRALLITSFWPASLAISPVGFAASIEERNEMVTTRTRWVTLESLDSFFSFSFILARIPINMRRIPGLK